ncbi:uncharacterized protein LOC101459882 [Ceratitis capitata]|uniref:uncharacterized protein LOC101459882 n=1 Tax=Ceratitis capitata TaxID=7213 RepID=UPI000C6C413A|nr:uncharacterized protein LOC101459882 [Ceratitis capitata]
MLTKANILLICNLQLLFAYPASNWTVPGVSNVSFIVDKINAERRINAFVIINAYDTSESCLSDEDVRRLSANTTVKLLRPSSKCSNSSGDDNRELLLIRCIPENFKPELFEAMIGCSARKRDIRMLFIWNSEYATATMQSRLKLDKQQKLIFEYCAKMNLLNVIGIYRDYLSEGHFYTFSYFPDFHLERKPLSEDCFPDRISDLKGTAIRCIPDQIHPWSIVWADHNENVQIGGFLTKLLQQFATRNNGTLTFPVTVVPNRFVDIQSWLPLFQNNTIDMVCGIIGSLGENPYLDESATIFPVDWIIMLPIPQRMADSEVYLYMLNSALGLFLLILLFVFSFVLTLESLLLQRHTKREGCLLFISFLTNTVLRGVIGQPTSLRVPHSVRHLKRFLYITLFVSGIFMSTFISASLQSYLTSSLRYPRINSFAELRRAGMKVKISRYEYTLLPAYFEPKTLKWLERVFTVVPSFDELQNQRINLKNRFATTIISPLWSVVSRYQSNLPQPAFYTSKNIYISKGIPIAVPIQKHSIYKKTLNKMIYNAHSVGLTQLWSNQVYDDMLAAKKLNTTVNLVSRRKEQLEVRDLYWLWWLYGVGVLLSTLVFFAELWYHKRSTKKANREQSEENERVEQYELNMQTFRRVALRRQLRD